MTVPDKFDWEADIRNAAGRYLSPAYYDRILKEYSFGGQTDLQLLRAYLAGESPVGMVCELGCGSGRATQEIVDWGGFNGLTLVDLSGPMLSSCAQRFEGLETVLRPLQCDSIESLASLGSTDILVSVWNLSHSIHQHMFRQGRRVATKEVGDKLRYFFKYELKKSAFLIHYDIQSDEQKLINPWRLDLWREADPDYDASGQSPSKLLLDEVLDELADSGHLDYTCEHLLGDPIHYRDSDEAMEVFMNFHMEGHYFDHPRRSEVVESLRDGFRRHSDPSGEGISIRPGCFVYTIAVRERRES